MKIKIILFSLSLLIACGKTEGPGGKNDIKGYVYVEKDFIDNYPAAEKNVYIIYGDNNNYGDKTLTNYDGYYEFEKLHKGNYTIFTYSACQIINANCPSGKEPIFIDVNLPDKKGTTKVDTVYIRE